MGSPLDEDNRRPVQCNPSHKITLSTDVDTCDLPSLVSSSGLMTYDQV